MELYLQVARTWKGIAGMLGVSIRTAKSMARRGLPVKWDQNTPTLSSLDYHTWHTGLPSRPAQVSEPPRKKN